MIHHESPNAIMPMVSFMQPIRPCQKPRNGLFFVMYGYCDVNIGGSFCCFFPSSPRVEVRVMPHGKIKTLGFPSAAAVNEKALQEKLSYELPLKVANR